MPSTPPTADGPPRREPRATWAWALVAAFLAAAVYVNALHNPFTFDDRTEILENASIRDLGNIRAIVLHSPTRPVVNVSYAVDYALWGLNPFGYHLTSLLLHVLNVLLVFALARGLARDVTLPAPAATRLAIAASALFAVHPLMTEAVGYVSGRSELVSGALMLGSLLLFRRGLPGLAAGWLAGGTALFLLALGAKETAAMLPFVLLACDALLGPRREQFWRRFRRVHLPLLSLVLLAGAARVWLYMAVEHPDYSGLQWGNLLVNLHVTARYVGLLIVPASQSVVHAVYPIETVADWRVVTAAAALGLVGAAAVRLRRRNPMVTFGIVWFALFLIPSAALIVLADRGQPMAEHRTYVASIGFFAAAAALIAQAPPVRLGLAGRRITATTAALGVVVVVFGGLTIARNRVWADSVGLWEDAARKAPLTYVSHLGVAEAYRLTGDCPSAIPSYERAIALSPASEEAYLRLAGCASEGGDGDRARLVLRAAVERASDNRRARVALAAFEEDRGNYAEALRLCSGVALEYPGDADAAGCVARNQSR